MIEFFALLTAHVLADFYFQPDHWVEEKRARGGKAPSLYLHAFLVAFLSYVLLGHWKQPHLAMGIGVIHGMIDWVKIRFDKTGGVAWFIYDQLAHLVSILLLVWLISDHRAASFEQLIAYLRDPAVLGTVAGLLVCLTPVSFLVGLFTRPWREELKRIAPGAEDNLDSAGRWIGMSERLLIFIFVLIGQYAAIGFLIAAKSLLRYNDKHPPEIPHSYISKKSEYVLIGTLVSYTCAVSIALLVRLLNSL